MSLLYRIRKSQLIVAKATLALFMSVWLSLALQPCAMAVMVAKDTPAHPLPHSQQVTQDQATNLASEAVHDHCGQKRVPDKAEQIEQCSRCLSHAADDPCQADDWSESKQTLQAVIDGTTDETVRLVVMLSLQQFKPASLGQHYRDTLSLYSSGITATSLHDVSRC